MKKPLKVVLGLGLVGFGTIQIDPAANLLPKIHEKHLNRPADLPFEAANTMEATLKAPDDVKKLLAGACYDCHSHATKWPWYSYVAPVKWFVIEHVNHGRRKANFSEFGNDVAEDQAHTLRECAEVVDDGEMPESGYAALHSEAKLSDADRKKLVDWFRAEADKLDPDGGKKKGGGKAEGDDK